MTLPLTSWTNWVALWMVLHTLPVRVTKIDWAPPCWDETCVVQR